MRKRINLEWKVGYAKDRKSCPEEMITATVPGAVQLDMAKAKGLGDYTYGDNWKDYSWMEDVYWTYETLLPEFKHNGKNKLYFVTKGIDYEFKIILDDEVIHEQEGMFTPVEIDLTDKVLSNNNLKIQIAPAPKREGAPADKKQADQCVKPAVSYGWDWHPRLIPLGIWDETYLEVRPVSHIYDSQVTYILNEDFTNAEVTLEAQLACQEVSKLTWTFQDRKGNMIFDESFSVKNEKVSAVRSISKPELWWPNGEGEAVLYTSIVRLYGENQELLDEQSTKVGFRRIRLIMHPGAWEYPKGHPCTRSNPPITLEINNRSIFGKGTNWVNPEIFPGIITKETYLPLLKLAKDAHMNLLRSWGGGIINKEAFFDLCDELGLLVWQEFPLACNNYEGTPHYLDVLNQESRSIIKRLKRHACIAIWCGGNELFNSWSGMTDQSLALRLLNSNCYQLDPNTPFLMTSPLEGMGHGNYLFRYQDGREVFQVMPQSSNTAYTEFGCPGPSSAEYLKTFIPEEELFPPRPGTVWETHHAFHAWAGDTWLQPHVIKDYFGEAQSLEELVEWGQLLQSEGYKCIYEEARRQKPRCSMALNWCYNEPWPTAANNSIINWPDIPKPAYYAVKESLRPVLASAAIPKFSFGEGEVFTAQLWILNDSPESVASGVMNAYLMMGEEKIKVKEWNYPPMAPGLNMHGPNIRFILPKAHAAKMTLLLETPSDPAIRSSYTLLYHEM